MYLLSDMDSIQDKLHILADAAKYDVSCTSSGVQRKGKRGQIGNSVAAGVCHSFSADGRCISLLKILYSNDCVYDCKYCQSRCSNSVARATFLPEEICTLVIEFYKRNYIEGLFLSSAVYKNPTYTMEQIFYTIYLLRTKYHFHGYIHVKAIPHTPAELIQQIGFLADRMSVNLELPTADGLATLAPHKTRSSILTPMRQIQNQIVSHRLAIGKTEKLERSVSNQLLHNTIFERPKCRISEDNALLSANTSPFAPSPKNVHASFVPAGQSTQLIVGATEETDYQILTMTQALYQQFDLKRVFYSAYIPVNEDPALPDLDTSPPLLREHRLYQADWLLRFYGFHAEELLTPEMPFFDPNMDPKCSWAIRHLEQFPLELSTASYQDLLRVPGIGNKSAMRILKARKTGSLSFESVKKMGVVLKRAQYFITCNGKMLIPIHLDSGFLTRQLTACQNAEHQRLCQSETYQQMSLFDDSYHPGS